MKSILEGRDRVLLEMNCSEQAIDALVKSLPAMRAPTVSRLYNEAGFSVKAAVARSAVKDLIPQLLATGATDILETPIRKVV